MPLYDYLCAGKCGREFEEYKSYQDRNDVFCCGLQAIKLICSNPTVFNDTKYIFTAAPGQFGKKGADVSGRSNFKKLLRDNGLADASVKECLSVKPSKDTGFKRKQAIKNTMAKIHKEGLAGSVKGFAKDVLNMKVKT